MKVSIDINLIFTSLERVSKMYKFKGKLIIVCVIMINLEVIKNGVHYFEFDCTENQKVIRLQ